jgi:V/A-type H+-transporting ATPase subunit A
MMRLLGRFIELAEAALAAGAEPEAIGAIGCMRALQRMGEEIGDEQLPRFDELAARMERDFAQLTAAAAPAAETSDATHG